MATKSKKSIKGLGTSTYGNPSVTKTTVTSGPKPSLPKRSNARGGRISGYKSRAK